MIQISTFKARYRAPLVATLILALASCNSSDLLDSNSANQPTVTDGSNPGTSVDQPSFATSFAGGIPMGNWHQPVSEYGSRYNGALLNIWPSYLKSNLAAIKSRGGKVALSFSGAEKYFKTSTGHFDMTKWKARVARYKNIDFASYIKDGTIIGHMMIDEPNDPHNWNGQPVTRSQLEAMAKYSKQLWPGLKTLVRAEPSYVGGGHYYLDAAWAQYVYRKGNVSDYLQRNVSDAQKNGLALVVGLNVKRGGPNGNAMTPSQVSSWGSTLLNSSYPCAFLSWEYYSGLTTSSMKSAMDLLRRKAQSRTAKKCG
jgi:hypothetical protein